MKQKTIFGIFMLILAFAACFGCGNKEVKEEVTPPEPVAAEETTPVPAIAEEQITDMEEQEMTEPEVPETPVEDVAPVTPEPEVTDVEEDAPIEEEDELTAENFRVVSLKDLKAYPAEMEIKVGTTVEWRNVNDNFQHIIGWKNQKGMGVTPEPILPGQSWSYTFTEPGVIKWFSTAKPTIQGTITVK